MFPEVEPRGHLTTFYPSSRPRSRARPVPKPAWRDVIVRPTGESLLCVPSCWACRITRWLCRGVDTRIKNTHYNGVYPAGRPDQTNGCCRTGLLIVHPGIEDIQAYCTSCTYIDNSRTVDAHGLLRDTGMMIPYWSTEYTVRKISKTSEGWSGLSRWPGMKYIQFYTYLTA